MHKNSEEEIFYYFINDAFDWNLTYERFDYWCDISHKMQIIGKSIYHENLSFLCDEFYSKEELEEMLKIINSEENG